MNKYIVLCGNFVSSGENAFSLEYDWDFQEFDSMDEAIEHGLTLDRSDDFNIAEIIGKRVMALYWMENKLEEPSEHLREIERQIF